MLGSIQVETVDVAALESLDGMMNAVVVNPYAEDDLDASVPLRLIDRLIYWTGEFQRQARIPVSRDHLRWLQPTAPPGGPLTVKVALPVASRQAVSLALNAAISMINSGLKPQKEAPPADAVAKTYARLSDSLKPLAAPGFNHLHLLDAAFRLRVPVTAIDSSKIRLGTGSRAHVVESTVTDETTAIGLSLSQDKLLTAHVLREIGLPVPKHALVTSADQALQVAQTLGYPVVVKPSNLDQGKGVWANLRSSDNLVAAYDHAKTLSNRILVEKHVPGFGHRLTVFRGELLAVLKRVPGGVVGDGQRSVEQLVAIRAEDPQVRRNLNLGRVKLDAEALAMLNEQRLTRNHVPASGEFIVLRRKDNISAGGTTVQLTPSDVHPDNRQLAVRAAKALYLDLAGVDVLIPDISVSWKVAGGVVCEVNGRPQFGPGQNGDNYLRLITQLTGGCPRIPVHLHICGDPETASDSARLETIRLRLGCQALSSRHGVWLDGICHATRFANSYSAARAALADRDIDSLVMSLSTPEIVANGLPVDLVNSITVSPMDTWPHNAQALLEDALRMTGYSRPDVQFE